MWAFLPRGVSLFDGVLYIFEVARWQDVDVLCTFFRVGAGLALVGAVPLGIRAFVCGRRRLRLVTFVLFWAQVGSTCDFSFFSRKWVRAGVNARRMSIITFALAAPSFLFYVPLPFFLLPPLFTVPHSQLFPDVPFLYRTTSPPNPHRDLPAPHTARARPACAPHLVVPRRAGSAVRPASHDAHGEGGWARCGYVVWAERGGGGFEVS
ncbi:hypothetical protein B0H13DRAFT_2042076 [Mycena leptocephala]|nr:hypothetical protein B0H13DRAFT_2042076 [Mycena leptocephala]